MRMRHLAVIVLLLPQLLVACGDWFGLGEERATLRIENPTTHSLNGMGTRTCGKMLWDIRNFSPPMIRGEHRDYSFDAGCYDVQVAAGQQLVIDERGVQLRSGQRVTLRAQQ
ncbi:MAG: hypothetical protein FIB01_15765 [Gemmatimonadetes bacterium]|nr:hypothetical protein [Gemmatimonadota bacterium]